MDRFCRFACAAALAVALGAGGVARATVIDFEDLSLAPGAYWNGSDAARQFSSRGAVFTNKFEAFPLWGMTNWNGFAYSNVNDPTTPGYLNQYAVFSGTGRGDSGNYAVGYYDTYAFGNPAPARLTLADPSLVEGLYLNNTTYTGLTIRDGDALMGTERFGGASGDDPDWYKVIVTGYDVDGASLGTQDVYLADYRPANNALDFVVSTWKWVDLSAFGSSVKHLEFTADSSDVGTWGINTPTYFAIDDIHAVPEPATAVTFGLGLVLALAAGRRRPSRE